MNEKFIKEYFIKEKNEEQMNTEIIVSILETKKEIESSRKNYEYAEDELIDYYLYNIKACQAKLNYLLKKAKKNGIIVDRIKEIEIRKNTEEKVV